MTGDELLDFVNNDLFPDPARTCQPAARRPARLRRPQRLRGRLQLHEVRHAAAPGDQQDRDEHRLQHSRRTATCSATSTRQILARPAERRQRRRVLHAARRHPVHGRHGQPASSARTMLDPACGTGGFLTCAIEHLRKQHVKTAEDEQHAPGQHPRRREEAAAAPALHHQHDAARHRRADQHPPRQHPRPPAARLRPARTGWT